MKLSRPFRTVAALIALVGVLFTQLVVAAYVCPSMQLAHAFEQIAASSAALAHHAMPGCEGMDVQQPVQCHTQVGTQSLDKPELPQVSPFVALTLQAAIVHSNAPLRSLVASTSPHVLTRTTSPPLSIRNCCFRI